MRLRSAPIFSQRLHDAANSGLGRYRPADENFVLLAIEALALGGPASGERRGGGLAALAPTANGNPTPIVPNGPN